MERIDHVFAGAIIAVSVVQAFADPATLKQGPRLTFFKAGAATGLGIGAAVLLVWYASERPLSEFGLFSWFGPSAVITAALAAAWPVILLLAMLLCLGPFRAKAADYYRSYEHLMPQSRRELAPAYLAGSLAAFGEEIAFRGFLIWYLHAAAGSAGAVLVSSIIFGIAHGYQGKLGILFATIAGLVLGGTYVLSGSLLLVMWMHASYNVASFTLGFLLLRSPVQVGEQASATMRS